MAADLIKVIASASNSLNAAGWKNYLQGSINNGSGALTLTDGAFTADDVGKRIAIDGAGTAGAIYEGKISAFIDATHVTVTPVAGTSVVGTTVSYGGRLADDRRNLMELRDLAFEADEAHYLALAETKGHWLRPEIFTAIDGIPNDTDLGVLMPRLGPLGRVFIQVANDGPYEPGRRAEPEEIARIRANAGGVYGDVAHNIEGSPLGGYFWMPEDENWILLTGTSAKIFRVEPYFRGAALRSPEIFTGSLASHIVAKALAKEGARTPEQARMHASYCEAVINGIRSYEQKVPTFDEFQREQAVGRRSQ